MPHVVAMCVREGRCDSPSHLSQPIREVIIFAAPTHEAFVEAIHGLKILAGDADVPSGKFWAELVANQLVPALLEPLLQQPPAIGRKSISASAKSVASSSIA